MAACMMTQRSTTFHRLPTLVLLLSLLSLDPSADVLLQENHFISSEHTLVLDWFKARTNCLDRGMDLASGAMDLLQQNITGLIGIGLNISRYVWGYTQLQKWMYLGFVGWAVVIVCLTVVCLEFSLRMYERRKDRAAFVCDPRDAVDKLYLCWQQQRNILVSFPKRASNPRPLDLEAAIKLTEHTRQVSAWSIDEIFNDS